MTNIIASNVWLQTAAALASEREYTDEEKSISPDSEAANSAHDGAPIIGNTIAPGPINEHVRLDGKQYHLVRVDFEFIVTSS